VRDTGQHTTLAPAHVQSQQKRKRGANRASIHNLFTECVQETVTAKLSFAVYMELR